MHRRLVLALVALVALSVSPAVRADEWETNVDGAGSVAEVEKLLEYKRGQAAEVYTLFYGLRDKLYVIRPQSKTSYANSLFTPQTVNYEVQLSAAYNPQAVQRLSDALSKAAFLGQGQNTYEIVFPGNVTRTIRLYDEVLPTFKVLVRDGYGLEARAVLLDKDRTVVAVSDNSLLVRVPTGDRRMDLSGKPLLQTYVPQQAPDIRKLLDDEGKQFESVRTQLSKHFSTQAYVLTDADKAVFYSLPLDTLRKSISMRVLRESDELILYKRDK